MIKTQVNLPKQSNGAEWTKCTYLWGLDDKIWCFLM